MLTAEYMRVAVAKPDNTVEQNIIATAASGGKLLLRPSLLLFLFVA